MLVYLRYTLATFCFTASVGCVGLWWRSTTTRHAVHCSTGVGTVWVEAQQGYIAAQQPDHGWTPTGLDMDQYYQSVPTTLESEEGLRGSIHAFGHFGMLGFHFVHFPLWYPALVFALAGVAVLRLGRRFTLRSAIIATTIVAGLLGMAVGL